MTTPSPEPSASRRPRRVHGPQYQMVTKQIRHQFGTPKARTPEQAAAFARVAGLIGSARSLACKIDREDSPDPCPNVALTGHDCRRHQVTARDYAQLHEQLARTLERIAGPAEPTQGQALQKLLQHLTPGLPPVTPPLPGIEP